MAHGINSVTKQSQTEVSAPSPDEAPPSNPRSWWPLGRPLLIGLVLTLLLFGLYEVLERLWLTGLEMKTLHLLHMVRGIVSSLLVAGVVGWIILRNSPGFWAVSTFPSEGQLLIHITPEERNRIYARWFIVMRWIAVVFSLCLVFISVRLVHWLPEEVWRPLMGIVVVLAGLNGIYGMLLRRSRWLPSLLLWQAYLDLVILTALLHFSGGIENPLSMMMLFHVIIGGILLSRRQCYRIAAVACILFALMAWAEWGGFTEHYTLQLFPHFEGAGDHGDEAFHLAHHSLYVLSRVFLQGVVLFLTAYFVTTLAERLRDNERRLETMADRATAGQQLLEQSLDTTGSALRVLSREGDIVWANRRWREWFPPSTEQHQRGNVVPSTGSDQLVPALKNGEVKVTELALPGTSPAAMRHDETRPGRVLQLTTAPLVDAQGGVERIVELAQDITEQKRFHERMMHASKLAAVGELAGRVAHEVNNPIAIISAKLRLLLSLHRREMSEKIADELVKATDHADRVARIAQGLLSYCRPSPSARSRLDPHVPLRKSLALVDEHARKAGIHIINRLPARMEAVCANADELEQVFLNLFLNAMDAMPKGGTLTLSASEQRVSMTGGRRGIALQIQDTGCGMTDSTRHRIFEPFFTTKPDGRGTGLGLSICQGLIRSHGGEIEVRSVPGQGSVFTVTLPTATPDQAL